MKAWADLPEVKYLCYGREHFGDDEGTPHLQGYIVMKNAQRLLTMRQLDPVAARKCHWELAIATTEANVKYCTKDGDYEEFGRRPVETGKRNDLTAIKEMIDAGADDKEVADAHFGSWIRYNKGFDKYRLISAPARNAKTPMTLILGGSGWGKSRMAWTRFPKAYPCDNRWMDGYDGKCAIILDDFNGWIAINKFLKFGEAYPLNWEVKGSTIPMDPEHVVVTATQTPDTWWEGKYLSRLFETMRRFDEVITLKAAIDFDYDLDDPENASKWESCTGKEWYQAYMERTSGGAVAATFAAGMRTPDYREYNLPSPPTLTRVTQAGAGAGARLDKDGKGNWGLAPREWRDDDW